MEPLNDLYRNICSSCPGTLWGGKSICRVYQKHIAYIKACPEWNKDKEIQSNSEPKKPVEITRQIAEDLANYHWMRREIQRMKSEQDIGNQLSSQYGVEASLPKKRDISDPVGTEVQYLHLQQERIRRLEAKVQQINKLATRIIDDRQRTVLDCILDGWKMSTISKHIGVSRTLAYEIKSDLVQAMVEGIRLLR